MVDDKLKGIAEEKVKKGESEKKADAKAKRRKLLLKRKRAETRASMIDLFKQFVDKGITSACDLGDGEKLVYHKDGKVFIKFDATSMQFPNKIVPTKLEGE